MGAGPTSAKIDRDYITAFGSRRRGERRGSAYDRKGRVVERRPSARANDKCIAKRAAGANGERFRDVTAHSDRSGFIAGEGPIHVGRIGRICQPGRCSSGRRSRWRSVQKGLLRDRDAVLRVAGFSLCARDFLTEAERSLSFTDFVVLCQLLVQAFRYRSFFGAIYLNSHQLRLRPKLLAA